MPRTLQGEPVRTSFGPGCLTGTAPVALVTSRDAWKPLRTTSRQPRSASICRAPSRTIPIEQRRARRRCGRRLGLGLVVDYLEPCPPSEPTRANASPEQNCFGLKIFLGKVPRYVTLPKAIDRV